MEKVKNIAVPVDFCENTEKLLDYAVYMGSSLSAVLHFVHVITLYSGDSMLGMPLSADFKASYEAQARERMAHMVDDLQEKCPGCTGEIVLGEPVDEIVKFAKSIPADLIVMSTHGMKGIEQILLGSVTKRVLKHAHCPVLVMNPFKKASES